MSWRVVCGFVNCFTATTGLDKKRSFCFERIDPLLMTVRGQIVYLVLSVRMDKNVTKHGGMIDKPQVSETSEKSVRRRCSCQVSYYYIILYEYRPWKKERIRLSPLFDLITRHVTSVGGFPLIYLFQSTSTFVQSSQTESTRRPDVLLLITCSSYLPQLPSPVASISHHLRFPT